MKPAVPPPVDADDLRRLFPAAANAQTMLHPGGIRGVVWDPPADIAGGFTGVWRRHSRQLLPEMAWLLPEVAERFGTRVTRIGLPVAGWDEPHPPRIWLDGTVVQVAWYAQMHARSATVTSGLLVRSLIVVDELPPPHEHHGGPSR